MTTPACRPRFPLGQVVATPGALGLLAAHGYQPSEFLARHARGDWGDVPPEDARSNEEALAQGNRLLSAYKVASGRVWVITEADRASSCLLLPEEY